MYLTPDEERMVDGELGDGTKLAIELLVNIGDFFNADRLIPISRAHWALSGQEGDLYFAESLAEGMARTTVPTTTNPAWDIDLKSKFNWEPNEYEMGLLTRTLDATGKLGAIRSFNCTPYLYKDHPGFGEHVAFSESSATPFINSVYGARTNRESSASALAAGIVGKTPNFGLHLDENRIPTVKVSVECKVENDFDLSMLGWVLGERIEADEIPYLTGINWTPTEEALRDFGALINTTSAIAMYHIPNVTPETTTELEQGLSGLETVTVTESDLSATKHSLSERKGKINSVYMGCPHSTIREIGAVEEILSGRKIQESVSFLIFTSRAVYDILSANGTVKRLGSLGVDILKDSCVDEPIFGFTEGGLGLTNSAKAAYYRKRRNQDFSIVDIKTMVEAAVEGEYI